MNLKLSTFAFLLFLGSSAFANAWAEQAYTVKPGDSLSSIAYRFYLDQAKWRLILEANPGKVSSDGALVEVGVSLTIPDDDGDGLSISGSDDARPAPNAGTNQIDLVTGDDFKPYTDDDLTEGGLLTEIVVRAFQEFGYEPAVDFVNWPAGYDLTRRGKFAATFPYVPTDERKQDFIYSDALADDLTYVFWHKDRQIDFRRLDDLKGLRVCRVAGYFTDFLDSLIETDQIEFHQPKQTEDCFLGMLDDTYDVTVQAEFESVALLAELELTESIVRSDIAVDARGLHLIFPKSDPGSQALRDEFNRAFRSLSSSGELRQIVERHMKAYFDSFETASN